jgi:Ricin-type beta-trefoil lectin domain-like
MPGKGRGTEEDAPLTLEVGARHALPVVNFRPFLALENTMTRIEKWSSSSLMTMLAIVLATGCVQQEDKKEEPAAAPAPPPAPPPEPTRVALAVDVKDPVTVAMAAGTKCLQFSGGSKADLAKAEIATCNGSPAQQFKFQSVPGGYYALVSANSAKCLDVSAFAMGDGALVQQYACNGGLNQNWIVADGGGGTVRFVARHSGKVLDVTGGGTADGTAVSQADWKSAPNQKFKLKGTPLAVAAGEGGKAGADGAGGSTGKKKPRKPKPATAAAP